MGTAVDDHPELKQAILQLIATSESNIPTVILWGTARRIHRSRSVRSMRTKCVLSLECHRPLPRFAQAKHYLNTTRLEMMEDIGDGYFACEYLVNTYECPQRWVVVYSTKAKRRNESIQKRKWGKLCEKAEMDLRRLRRKTFSCQADAQRAILEYAKKHHFADCEALCVHQETQYKKKGRPAQDTPFSVNYSIRGEFVVLEGAFEQWCQSQYFFILTTNDLDEETFSKKEILSTYKSQQSVERGFRFLKSPEFFTSAFFVKKPERIEALLMIMTLSLLVYSAIEYKIRQELQGQRVDFVDQRKKPTRKPTARWVFFCFLGFHVVYIQGHYRVVNRTLRRKIIIDILGHSYAKYYSERWRPCLVS